MTDRVKRGGDFVYQFQEKLCLEIVFFQFPKDEER